MGNFAVFGTDPVAVDARLTCISDAFTKLGLVVHEVTPACQRTTFVAFSFDHGHLSVKPERLAKLQSAIAGLLCRGRVSGHALEVILGHIAWAVLIRREAL